MIYRPVSRVKCIVLEICRGRLGSGSWFLSLSWTHEVPSGSSWDPLYRIWRFSARVWEGRWRRRGLTRQAAGGNI